MDRLGREPEGSCAGDSATCCGTPQAVATACGLDLEDIAQANLARTKDRYSPVSKPGRQRRLPKLRRGYPDRGASPAAS